MEGYETSVDGFNITNTYTTETTEVKGSKTWNDADNQDGKRPESITVRLLANGEEKDSQTVTADENGNWTYSFEKLPATMPPSFHPFPHDGLHNAWQWQK